MKDIDENNFSYNWRYWEIATPEKEPVLWKYIRTLKKLLQFIYYFKNYKSE